MHTFGAPGTATVVFLTVPHPCLRDTTATLKCITVALTTVLKVEPRPAVARDALAVYAAFIIWATGTFAAGIIDITYIISFSICAALLCVNVIALIVTAGLIRVAAAHYATAIAIAL